MSATSKQSKSDVIILGGGPAGMSTALWCAELGVSCLLIERNAELGGQLLWTYNPITNHLGVSTSNGREMRDVFVRQLENRDFSMVTGADVVKVDLEGKTVYLADGRSFGGRFLVFATGVARRRLGIPGEVEFAGKGVLESGVKAKGEVGGKRVVIVGGGDAAIENALILSETAEKVYLIHRRHEFTAQPHFLEELTKRRNVEVLTRARLSAICGADKVEHVEFTTEKMGEQVSLETDLVLIRVGVTANTDLLEGNIRLDASGFVEISSECETSHTDIFAVGDIAAPLSPTISSAVGHGATAAKTIASRIFTKQ